MNLLKRTILPGLIAIAMLSACDNKFDEHNAATDPLLNVSLLAQVKANPELSKFSEYLTSSGYDSVLASSKTLTVWAPTNAALQTLDATLINTKEKLKLFIGNHIANQAFRTTSLKQPFIRVKTLNGKNVTFNASSVDGSVMTSKDVNVLNGVLHTISSVIVPKVSAWEYLMSTNTLQKAELASLTYTFYDLTKAEVVSIDPKTGLPVYKPGTGIVSTNRFLDRFTRDGNFNRKQNDISNEDSTFTYIVLTDAAFLAEQAKLSKYYKLSTQDSTDSVTKFNVIKDLSFRSLLDKDNFPATSFSQGDSVKFHLDKNAVVQTIPVSNGIVYVMNSLNYELGDGTFDRYTKIKPIVIQAETGASFQSSKTTAYPVRKNPDGSIYQQMTITNPAAASYWVRYRPAEANSVKYKVYWRVVREDVVPAAPAVPLVATSDLVWSAQRVTFLNPATIPLPYVAKPGALPVMVNNVQQIDPLSLKFLFTPDYNEVLLGEYTLNQYFSTTLKSGTVGTLPVYLVASTVTTNGLNNLLLDYIKLVPVP